MSSTFLAFMSPVRDSGGGIGLTILLGVAFFAVLYFIWKKTGRNRIPSTVTEHSQLDGTFAILILNIFAMLSIAVSIVGVFVLIVGKSDPMLPLGLLAGGLISYATLTAQVVLLQNIIQIRRNTNKPSAAA